MWMSKRHNMKNSASPFRVVHLHDDANVAGILTKYLDKYHNLQVPVYIKPYNTNIQGAKFYNMKTLTRNRYLARLLLLRACRKANILHVHTVPSYSKYLRKLFPKKKIIYHIHGYDNFLMYEQRRHELESYADKLLLATNHCQYLEYKQDAEYLPNPIDIEHFSKRPVEQNNRGRILVKDGMSIKLTKKWLEENGYSDIEMDFVYVSEMAKKVSYQQLPAHLATYEYIADLDLRWGSTEPWHLYNMIGLQAMSIGCKVIAYDGIHDSLPPEHHPKKSVGRLYEIYRELME